MVVVFRKDAKEESYLLFYLFSLMIEEDELEVDPFAVFVIVDPFVEFPVLFVAFAPGYIFLHCDFKLIYSYVAKQLPLV